MNQHKPAELVTSALGTSALGTSALGTSTLGTSALGTDRVTRPSGKIIVFSTKGAGSNDETRICDLLSRLSPKLFAFDRSQKARSFRKLWQLIRDTHPDLIVLEGTGIFGGAAVIMARMFAGARYVVSSGDAVGPWIGTKSKWLQPLFAAYERVLCRLASGFIGWTPYLVGRALTFGTPRAMTAAGWAPYRCDVEETARTRERMRQSLEISPATIVIGIAGSLVWSRRRGYCYGAELVQAAMRCQRRDVCWLIVGDGDGRARLEKAAEAVTHGRVIFTGHVPQSELPAYLAAMDVGSLPQSVDGVGSFRYTTKVSEYLAFKLPFVTGQTPLAYDFPSGWLWRLPGSEPWGAEYADSLARFIEQLSWQAIQQKRIAIPERIDLFDRDMQVDRATAFIEEILAT